MLDKISCDFSLYKLSYWKNLRCFSPLSLSLSIRFFSFLLSRLYGGYEALKGGKTSEAMTDFTGGVVESYDLKKSDISLFDRITRNIKLSSLMSCSIKVKKNDNVHVICMYTYIFIHVHVYIICTCT